LRSVGADGRSRAHLGGRAVPVGTLGDLAEQLLAVHGQNDQLRLLRPGEQRAVLDRFAGERLEGPLADYRAARQEWSRVSAELTERTTRSRELAQQADLLRHGISEIDAVAPQPGEDTALSEEIKRLMAVDELRAAAGAAPQTLVGGPDAGKGTDAATGLGPVAQDRRGPGGASPWAGTPKRPPPRPRFWAAWRRPGVASRSPLTRGCGSWRPGSARRRCCSVTWGPRWVRISTSWIRIRGGWKRHSPG